MRTSLWDACAVLGLAALISLAIKAPMASRISASAPSSCA